MPAGYTLKAYSENQTLSSEGTDKTISIVTIPEDELGNAGSLTTSLTDNTWGLAIEEPTSHTDQIYYSLPQTQEEAVTIATVEDNSNTTVYYGVYITPDMPYGTYTGATVSYDVEPNMTSATVVFDGNGKFYFDGTPSTTTNTMEYTPGGQSAPQYSHTPNVNDEGIQTEGEMYPLDSNETFVYEFTGVDNVYVDVVKTGNDSGCGPNQDDYFSIWSGAHADFTAKANWETALSLKGSDGKNVFDNNGKYDGVGVNVEGDSVTIAYTTSDRRDSWCAMSGYGYYARVIGYNSFNESISGEYEIPSTDGAYRFLGWSEDKDATTPTYKTAADIERALSLTTGETATLYAISEPAIVVTYNGNGADTTTDMDNVEQYTTNVETTSQVDLLASNFTKDGYGFVGWSTDTEAWDHLTDNDDSNNPTIYGPNQTITVDPAASTKLALYAIWAPAEVDNNGTPVSLQDWQGCSTLTPTTYDSTTNTLSVGKNTITALTDSRDGNIYTVARLADGNCWMTENLRLDNEATISTTNTNNPLTVDGNVAIKNNDDNASAHLSPTNSDWCYVTWDDPEQDALCTNQSYLNTNNTVLTTASPTFSQDFTNNAHKDFNDSISSYSNYYNWYSATAGNGGDNKESGEIAGAICPAGWQLPIGDETTGNVSFWNLNLQMGSKYSQEGSQLWRSFPNNFVYSGSWYGSSAYDRGKNGNYWSSTAGGTISANYLYFYSDEVSPGANRNSKDSGYSVRCIAPVQ